jgi:hypothetical protein
MQYSRALALIAFAVVMPATALAQVYKDNTSPPIDVPTAPVPQGPTPPPAAKPPPPAPAPAPAKPTPKPEEKKDGAAAPPPKAGAEETSQPKYNNEGVFKISGTKGPGYIGGDKPKTGGKTVAGKTTTTKSAVKAKSNVNVAQWPGFRMTDDGGSEVMVEFSQNPSAPTEHKAAGTVTYIFKGAHVIKSNNQNPLLTIHFNTPVASARLTPKKGELHLVIHYRAGADAAPTSGLRASSDGDGQQFFVKFGAGTFLPKGAENEEMPPPPTQKLKNKPEKTTDTPPPTKPKSDTGAKTGPNP